MFNVIRTLLAAVIFLFGLGLFNIDAQKAEASGPNASIVYVYASWSVTSRELKPVVEEIAAAYKLPLKEFDIDSASVTAGLAKHNITVPARTPFVAVIKQGKVVFKKAYPNGQAEQLKEDLTNLLANFY